MNSMLIYLKRFLYFILVTGLLSLGVFLIYYLPSTKKAYLVGTEIKREVIQNTKGDSLKDVRYIVARDHETGKTLMFRNEDVPWPPYFKFNSGDLSGEVMNIHQHSPDKVVNITYYGFRFPMLSLYPNATKLRIVPADYQHTPWFNMIFLSILFLVSVFFFLKIRKIGKNRKNRKKNQIDTPTETVPS